MPQEPACSACNGTGKGAKTKTFNPLTGRVLSVSTLPCSACGGTGKRS